MADIYLAAIEMDRGNKAIFVTPNIKHDKLCNFVCRWKCGTQGTETIEFALAHDFEPARQSTLTVRILLPEDAEHFTRDYVHKSNISQIEIWRKVLQPASEKPTALLVDSLPLSTIGTAVGHSPRSGIPRTTRSAG